MRGFEAAEFTAQRMARDLRQRPASSTPVAPAPTTTNGKPGSASNRVGLALCALEGEQDAGANLERILEVLSPGAKGAQASLPK